ncbi:MAG: hypothetical protein E5299_00713 [Burkholderia gladioli]|nr:MAG: hypothetical protein E5299_00713 [Burkholderia gladioli]
MASTDIISGDMNGLRTSEARHAVNCAAATGDLGRLRCDVTRPEAVSGERLKPIHRIFGQRSPVVVTAFLRVWTVFTGNCINRAVPPRRTGRIRWPMNGPLAWRNRRNRTACSNGRIAWLGVVGTVFADDIDLFFARNLVEQLGQSVTFSHILMRHQRGIHLTRIRVQREIDLTPRAPLQVAVLAATPSIHLHHRPSDRFCRQPDRSVRCREGSAVRDKAFSPAKERSVIRHRQAQGGQIAQTLGETLQDAQRPVDRRSSR